MFSNHLTVSFASKATGTCHHYNHLPLVCHTVGKIEAGTSLGFATQKCKSRGWRSRPRFCPTCGKIMEDGGWPALTGYPFQSGERVSITNIFSMWVLMQRSTADRVLSRYFFSRHRTVACRGHRLSCCVSAAACFNNVNSQYSPGLKRKQVSWLVTTPMRGRPKVAASFRSLSAFSTQMLSTVDYSVGANSRTSDGLLGPCRGGCEKWQLKRGEMRPLSQAQTQNVISEQAFYR